MIRMLILFVALTLCITVASTVWQTMTGTEKWQFTKNLVRGIIISGIAVFIMTAIYILF